MTTDGEAFDVCHVCKATLALYEGEGIDQRAGLCNSVHNTLGKEIKERRLLAVTSFSCPTARWRWRNRVKPYYLAGAAYNERDCELTNHQWIRTAEKEKLA